MIEFPAPQGISFPSYHGSLDISRDSVQLGLMVYIRPFVSDFTRVIVYIVVESSTEAGREASQPRREKMSGHKPGVRWPGAAEGRTWEVVNSDLVSILGRPKGTAESKLEKMGDIIYSYGKERFGIVEKRTKRQHDVVKSRRQQEIDTHPGEGAA